MRDDIPVPLWPVVVTLAVVVAILLYGVRT